MAIQCRVLADPHGAGRLALAATLALAFGVSVRAAEDTAQPYDQVVAGVHFDSSVSGGPLPIVDLVKKAYRHGLSGKEGPGMQVVVMTDRDQAEIEYGPPLLRNLLKHKFVLPSIRTYGAERYLADIADAQALLPQMVVVPGAECMPYYRWVENFKWRALLNAAKSRDIGKVLRLRGAHEHLLAIGMDRAEDYEDIPSLANGYPFVLSSRSWVLLVYLGLMFFGVRLFRGRRPRRRAYYSRGYRRRRALRRLVGAVFVLSGFALFANHVLSPPRQFEAYGQDPGVGPYQAFIDYVNDRGGLVFWAHPEVAQTVKLDTPLGAIEAHTPAYQDHLTWTRNYAGFAIFWEGMRHIGKPGGVWDSLLTQYCDGRRERPVWALGELDYDSDWAENAIEETVTVLLLRNRTRQVVKAFRAGMASLGEAAMASRLPVEAVVVALRKGGLPRPMEEEVVAAVRQGRLRDCSEAALADALRQGAYRRYGRREVMDGLRNGRMYATRSFAASRVRVDKFTLASEDSSSVAYSGDTLDLSAPGFLRLHVRAVANTEPMEFRVIRNGSIFKVFIMAASKPGQTSEFITQIAVPSYDGIRSRSDRYMDFYRVLGYEDGQAVLATNPIFAREAKPAAGSAE